MEAIIAFIQTKNFNLKLGEKQITVSIYMDTNLIAHLDSHNNNNNNTNI